VITAQGITSTLSPETLRSWPVFIVTLGWSTVIHFLDVTTDGSDNPALRIAVVLAAHLITFSVVWLIAGFLRWLPPVLGALSMIPAAGIVGMLRGFVFAYLLFASGIDSEPLVSYRVFGGFAAITLPIMITAIIVKQVRDFQSTRSRLFAETAQLESALAEARMTLDSDMRERSATIRETILGSLQRWQGASAVEAAATIKQTMDDIVRPLSHRLDSAEPAWTPRETTQQASKVRWREALIGLFEPRNLRPTAIAITTTGFGVNFLFQHQTIPEALYALTAILGLTWLSLAGLRRVLYRVSNTRHRMVPGVYAFGVFASAVIVGLAVSPIRADSPEPFALLIYALIFVFAFAVLFSTAASASEQARDANRRLADAADRLAWEVARMSEEIRQLTQAMARDLHGRVQTGFMAALMKLHKALDSGNTDINQLTTDTVAELERIVSTIGTLETEGPHSLASIFDKVSGMWEEVATIHIDITELTLADIERDAVLSRTLADLIPELVFNAIRHGGATEVTLTLRPNRPGVLAVRCLDNGAGPQKSSKIGLGTKLLTSCALKWRRFRDAQTTVTELTLPISPASGNNC
jgi:signal transduction histidine kinase